MLFLVLVLAWVQFCSSASSFFGKEILLAKKDDIPKDYGVDVSYPIHHVLTKKSFFGDRYDKMINQCYSKYSLRECDGNERARIAMNLEQPATQQNYTEIGFKKTVCPESAWKPLLEFWQENKNKQHNENW